ncbi:MAG: NAD(P)H-binding protein [Hyphomicrobiaceae bacterium]
MALVHRATTLRGWRRMALEARRGGALRRCVGERFSRMAVIVTGATGRIGHAMVQRLLAEGAAVRVLSRRPLLAQDLFGGSVEIHEWHPFSENVPAAALDGVRGVLHLMGAPFADGPIRGRDALATSSRLVATRRMIDALAGCGVRLLVVSPAIVPREVPAGAVAAHAFDGMDDLGQGGAPLPWEEVALAAHSDSLSVAVVRLGLLTQPSEALVALVALARMGLVPKLDGAQIGAITPGDATAMLSGLLARSDLTGLFHGVAPIPIPGQVIREALEQLRPAFIPGGITLPSMVTTRLLARYLGLLATILTASQVPEPRRLLAAGAVFETPDPTDALLAALQTVAELDVQPTSGRLRERVKAVVGPVVAKALRRGQVSTAEATPQATGSPATDEQPPPPTAQRPRDRADGGM